jgi:hypothetical protein
MSALYSAVLFLGLLLALAAVDNLFGADIKPETYFRLWIIIAGLFNTWVFLAGVPKDLDALNQSGEYPNGLKVFTQFILLPLVGLYFAILIAYEAKIIVTWNWPKGWVSELVLWYSVIGILSLLLLHPLRDRIESRWIQAISKWYYLALVPLVAMLFLAIMRRISDYGVTEMRYFVFAMAVGLTIVMVYMIISKRKDVRLIPIVICLIAFFSAYGPWSAFAVSRSDQQDRLEALMVKNGILIDGIIKKADVAPTLDDRREMSNVVNYLNELHGIDAFTRWVPDSTRAILDTLPIYVSSERITHDLGFVYVYRAHDGMEGEYFNLHIEVPRPIDISGYHMMLTFENIEEGSHTSYFQPGDDPCKLHELSFDSASTTLTLRMRGVCPDTGLVSTVPLEQLIRTRLENPTDTSLSPQDLTFPAATGDLSLKVIVSGVEGRLIRDSLVVNSVSGFVLSRQIQ